MKYTDDHKNLSNVKKATENPEPLFELRIKSCPLSPACAGLCPDEGGFLRGRESLYRL